MAYFTPDQSIRNSAFVGQVQDQSLIIKNSHAILVTQVEAQAVVVLQLAIEAALEAVLIAFDFAGDDADVLGLQAISQQLSVLQRQRERVVIECSDNITINQIQAQLDVVVQAAIDLLAKITVKFLNI
ncbi:MAG TPA: hypothetical protein DCY20_01335 [Firmicutes bacterium]|nr:hypothetical protein [Bacillota bacterium]